MGAVNFTEIFDKADDTDYLKRVVESSNTATTALMNMSRVASELYLARTLKSTGDSLADEIEEMTATLQTTLREHAEALVRSAEASEKHAKSLTYATWALVAATVGLLFATLIGLLV